MSAHYRAQHRRGNDGDESPPSLPRRVPGASLHPAMPEVPREPAEGVSPDLLARIIDYLTREADP